MSKNKQLTRRAFIAATTTTAAGAIAQNTARVAPGKISPNDTVRVGLIGLGARCQAVAKSSFDIPDMRIAAICDCFKPRVDSCLGALGNTRNWRGYTDFREMIEKENLDGVMVETTTHARAWVTCHAMAAGMDVYIEKPMSLTIAEGREMVKIARKYKRVTQVGTQQRSIPLNNWTSDLVQNGAIGKIKEVLAPNFVGPLHWEDKPGQPLPEGGSDTWWDTWTNQAAFRPYHPELQRRWNKYWAYDSGGPSFGVTGWGTHSYDQIQRGLGTSETGPSEIVLEEPLRFMNTGKYEERTPSPGETGARYYSMAQKQFGPRAKVRMKFANGTVLRLNLDGDYGPGLGAIFIGEKGRIEINRDHVSSDIDGLVNSASAPPHLTVPETQPHIENWIQCIKSRETCNADIEYGQRSSTICYLVNIARDVGKVGVKLNWDPEKERFKNCDEGNDMLHRARRKGFDLPT